MSYFSCDVESDGPIPGLYSMVCFGAVLVDDKLDRTFYGKTKPISEKWKPDALAISGFSREEHEKFPEPVIAMIDFNDWIMANSKGRPIFIADNPAYDFAWINYYFHMFNPHGNPFGFSARRLGDLACGMERDTFYQWKHMRKTKHNHDPVADAKGNAEVLLQLRDKGLKINLQ